MVATGQVLIGLCCLISFAVCALRFYMRVVVSRQFVLLEFTLIFALVMQITLGSLQIKMFEILAAIKTPEDAVRLNAYFFAGTFFYLTALWSVKISVNLLHIRLSTKIPGTHVWAIRSLYFMVISLIGAYIVFLLGCVPIHRRWDAPLGRAKPCPPIMREWDFWLHTALNIGTDIWLCILPYPALLQLRERRLRIAVGMVYGLVVIVIAVSIIRAVLLGNNAQANVRYIMVLTMVEVATSVVVGSLPGISSFFIRKYVYGGTNDKYFSSRGVSSYYKRTTFSQLREPSEGGAKNSIELSTPQHQAVITAGHSEEYPSRTGSTGHTVIPEQIQRVTRISVSVA